MSHASMLRPTEEIADFFARAPSQQEIAAFRLSDAAQARARDLLDKNSSGTLTPEEAAELDELVVLDRLVTLIRSRLPRPEVPTDDISAATTTNTWSSLNKTDLF